MRKKNVPVDFQFRIKCTKLIELGMVIAINNLTIYFKTQY